MKRFFFLSVAFLFSHTITCSQNIMYSDINKDYNGDIIFEILGKVGPNYIVYKNKGWRHVLQVFDRDMHTLANNQLSYIPEKTFNVDFVTHPDFFYMIYQYEKGHTIYCKAVKFDQNGKKLSEPIQLDTTRISSGNNKIYTTVSSEDKQKILIFKMVEKNDVLIIASKVFDNNLIMKDSIRFVVPYNERKELYTDLQVANDGSLVFVKATKSGMRENINDVELITFEPGDKVWSVLKIPLEDKFIDEVKIKIDNLNNKYIINSFYYLQRRGSIQGLFTGVVNKFTNYFRGSFNPLNDSLRSKITSTGQLRNAFDNLFLNNIFVKKDGGFLVVAEDYSTQTRGTNSWNRWDYLYNYPYYNYSSSYYPYYRQWNRFNNLTSTRYFYDNILVMGVDSSLKLQWNNIIYKNQSDDDNDNFLSYATLNEGAEIHFLFIEKVRTSQIIANHSIYPNGTLFRHPTLKNRDAGYLFMPRLSKQTGVRQLIVPCIYRGYISFAKVDY